MTIEKAMRTYRLPNPTTPEDLACGWSKTLTFGDRLLVAGHYYQHNRPCYYGAVYLYGNADRAGLQLPFNPTVQSGSLQQ